MAVFSIATATLSVNVGGGAVLYKALDVQIATSTEAVNLRPLDAAFESVFAGEEGWSGSFSIAYDDTTSTPNPSTNHALALPALRIPSALIMVMTKAATGTVTLTGNIVITGTSVTFNKTSVPVMEVTFVGSGNLTQT